MRIWRWLFNVFVALLAAGAAGCPDNTPTLIYEIDGVENQETLTLRLKRYNDDGTVDFFDAEPIALREATKRLSLQVPLPSPGRWAVHMVAIGSSGGRPASETRCHVVQGVVVDSDVHLSVLSPAVDADGDTFPDDLRAYCSERTAEGLSCANDCEAPEFLALLDCNPAPDQEFGELCPQVVPPDASWHPFAEDRCADCFDQDCYGGDPPECEDRDEDGYRSDVDCDDDDPTINPSSEEGCRRDETTTCPGCGDDVDNDCDGAIDEGCFGDDFDQDGVPADEDCNDCDPGIGPGFPEICGNGVDEDCSAPGDPAEGDLPCDEGDLDQDGFVVGGTADCDDTNPRIHPGAPDRCGDGVIQNCSADRECTNDEDGDQFNGVEDCDDSNPDVNPWATEVCDPDGVDENCDGRVNEVRDPAHRRGCGLNMATEQWVEIDFQTDPEHCGACRNRCSGTTWSVGDQCQGGQCLCGGGPPCEGSTESWCCPGSGCVDISTDARNCGRCGVACQPGEECRRDDDGPSSSCTCPYEEDGRACPPGPCWRCCPDAGCVNVCDDMENCGACGTQCAAGERPRGDDCVEGQCVCGDLAEVCTGTTFCTWLSMPDDGCGCRDLLGDTSNCGSCGNVCGEGELCNDGVCGCGDAPCPEGTVCCPSGCADRATDVNNCGECGNQCNPGEVCQGGACVCGPECEDGDPCTTGTCTGSTCTQATNDADGDGYCEAGCPDAADGTIDCINGDGDCNDHDASIHPNAPERCNGLDDDCVPDTPDGVEQCSEPHQLCDSESAACACEAGWSDCGAGACTCNTGGGQVCCAGSCRDGECCNDADCSRDAPTCRGNTCVCDGILCEGSCVVPAEGTPCCNDADCGGETPFCNWITNVCECPGIACFGACHESGNCCSDADCSAGRVCCSNRCAALECCDRTDCPGAHPECNEGSCDCEAFYTDCDDVCDCRTGDGSMTCCPTGTPRCRAAC